MLTEKEAQVTVGGDAKIYKLKVKDIFSCDDFKEFSKPDGSIGKIEYPYRIQIVEGKRTVSNEPTTASLYAKDWMKKFYKATTGSGNELVAYTRNHTLLALIEIMKAKNGLKIESGSMFNLNSIVGYEFEGVLVELKDRDPFIDWVSTFEHNGIKVPTLNDFLTPAEQQVRKTVDDFAKEDVKAEAVQGDLNSLPF